MVKTAGFHQNAIAAGAFYSQTKLHRAYDMAERGLLRL